MFVMAYNMYGLANLKQQFDSAYTCLSNPYDLVFSDTMKVVINLLSLGVVWYIIILAQSILHRKCTRKLYAFVSVEFINQVLECCLRFRHNAGLWI